MCAGGSGREWWTYSNAKPKSGIFVGGAVVWKDRLLARHGRCRHLEAVRTEMGRRDAAMLECERIEAMLMFHSRKEKQWGRSGKTAAPPLPTTSPLWHILAHDMSLGSFGIKRWQRPNCMSMACPFQFPSERETALPSRTSGTPSPTTGEHYVLLLRKLFCRTSRQLR